jgi:hypothetical protein
VRRITESVLYNYWLSLYIINDFSRTGEQGMIFRELVEDLDAAIDPNTVFSWFHPNCTKSEAVDMLVKGLHILLFIN